MMVISALVALILISCENDEPFYSLHIPNYEFRTNEYPYLPSFVFVFEGPVKSIVISQSVSSGDSQRQNEMAYMFTERGNRIRTESIIDEVLNRTDYSYGVNNYLVSRTDYQDGEIINESNYRYEEINDHDFLVTVSHTSEGLLDRTEKTTYALDESTIYNVVKEPATETEYKYVFDENLNIIQSEMKNEFFHVKTVVEYVERSISRYQIYRTGGVLSFEHLFRYDKDGCLVGHEMLDMEDNGQAVYFSVFTDNDSHGNWTKSELVYSSGNKRITTNRSIEYFD